MAISRDELAYPTAAKVAVSDDALTVALTDRRVISVPLEWYPRLVHATPKERNNVELYGDGTIHWPDLDEDISVEGMRAGRP